jgi:hypothetical protein
MAEAFSLSIKAHKDNIEKIGRDYSNSIKNLRVFRNTTVLMIISEPEEVIERLQWQELASHDYEHFIDTGQLPSPEAMSEKCPR